MFEAAAVLLAAGAKTNPPHVSLLERGMAKPDIALGIALRDVCSIPIDAWEQPLEQKRKRSVRQAVAS